MAFAFFQHVGELEPRFGRRMLAAEFSLAVAPTAARNHRGDALVGAAGEHGHSRAEAAPDQRDALWIYFRARRHVGDRIAGICHLIEADDSAVLAFAFAAAAKVDAQSHVAPLV